MKKLFIPLVLGGLLCVSCAATIGPHGASVSIAPALPVTVELVEPYYAYGGYYYYYNNARWYYSRAQSGPWIDLPRDRYPKEVRQRGNDHNHGNQGRGRKIGHDRN